MALSRPGFECVAQRGPGNDAQLGKDLVQAGSDGPVRQEKPLADLLVSQAGGGRIAIWRSCGVSEWSSR
jgi:hypothetical protein